MSYQSSLSNGRRDTLAVILVSYMQRRFIREALDGVRLQTRVPDEVVIADDGSTDGTQDTIRAYVKEHGLEGQWTLLFSPVNRGINSNIQEAVDRTRASIIVPMAGDDVSLPNRCAVAEDAFLRNPQVAIVITNGFVIDDNSQTLRTLNRVPGVVSDVRLAIRRGNPLISAVGQSWRRTLFDRFGPLPTDVPNEDDQISFWGLLSGGILCIPDRTFKYRVHDASASAWLRTRQTPGQYFERFVRDMSVREKHMNHWQECLAKSDVANRATLITAAMKKSEFYRWLTHMESASLIARLQFCFSRIGSMSVRDTIYAALGRGGVLAWRELRHLLRRA